MDGVKEHEVLVIGAGQAGLALSYFLRQAGIEFIVVDAGSAVGHVWRSRWDSLRLFTAARYASLPGMDFPAPADSYPGRDQVADYLAEYARRFELPIRLDTAVTRLVPIKGGFAASTSTGETIRAGQVVVATGTYSRRYVPPSAAGLAPEVTQFHTADYRSPAQVPDGSVVVVGGGNSGFQIATELAEAGRTVVLSEGRRNAAVPQRPLGRDIFWWQERFGLLRKTADTRFGRRMKANDGTVIGSSRRRLRRRGVTFRPRLTRAEGRVVGFADGTTAEADTVVWATGYVIDDSWIEIPAALDERGRLMQTRGVVAGAPGLYTLGRSWQHTIGSSLLGFVKHDAEWLSRQLTERESQRQAR